MWVLTYYATKKEPGFSGILWEILGNITIGYVNQSSQLIKFCRKIRENEDLGLNSHLICDKCKNVDFISPGCKVVDFYSPK